SSAAKLVACCRSCAYSPDRTMSSPPGPKFCSKVFTSNLSAASISASTACCGVSKLRVPTVEAAGVADGLSMGDCCAAKGAANRKAEAAVQPSQRYFEICLFAAVDFTPVLLLVSYLRRPPPPRPPPPPPPPPARLLGRLPPWRLSCCLAPA